MYLPQSAPPFCICKENFKNTKEKSVWSLTHKTVYIYVLVSGQLIGQHSWSPDELNDTHLARIACHIKLHAQLHAHAIWQEIACTCNFLCMQLPQDGCRPTRMSFRNAVLWDGHSQPDKYAHFCTILIRVNFPLYYLKFPLYIYTKQWCTSKRNASIILNLFLLVSYGPYTATFVSPFTKRENLYFWNTLIHMVSLFTLIV